MSKFPLWLPEGSVRSILALGIVAAFVYALVVIENVEVAAAIGVLATMVVKDYFSARGNS